MNKLTAALAFAAAALVAAPVRAQAPKIVVVDGGKILNESLEGKRTIEALQKRSEAEKARLQGEQDKLRALFEDYQKKKDSMSPEAVEEKEAELQSKDRRFRAMVEASQTRIQRTGAAAEGRLREKLGRFIENWAKAAGYDLVLNADASFYTGAGYDVTDAAMKAFNEEYIKAGQPEITLPEEPQAGAAPAPAPADAGSAPRSAPAPAPKTGTPRRKP